MGSHQAADGCRLHGNFTLTRFSRNRPHCLRRLHGRNAAYHARTMAVRELSSLLCHDRMPSDVFQPDIFLINRKLIYTAKMGWPVMRVAALRKYTADVAAITPKEDQT